MDSQPKKASVTIVRVLLTRAEWDRAGSRDCRVEGGGLLHPLDTGYHLGQSGLFKSSSISNLVCFITNHRPYV